MKNVTAGANPIILRKGISMAVETAVKEVLSKAKKVNGSKDIAKVAAISAGDEYIGKLISEAMDKVTSDGVITVEESKSMVTELEVVEGMQFDRGYLSSYMCTDMDKMEANLDNPFILITDKKISNIQEILPLLEQVVQSGAKLLIIAEDVKKVQGKEVINLRGSVIPLVRLNEMLDIESLTPNADELIVLIAKKGDRFAGLVVDELIGQMEIVPFVVLLQNNLIWWC